MTDRYALFGNPVRHSLSPRIHAAFAAQTGADLSYEAREVPLDGFAAAADDFFRAGGRGLNVTLPFKGEAFEHASSLTRRARGAQAVNLLRPLASGGLEGDNTDGAGLLRDLRANLGWELEGRRILLLGAGGAARGAAAALLQTGVAQLWAVNRTPERARQLAALFADRRLRGGGFGELPPGESFELIINASSAGLQGEAPPLPDGVASAGARAYDMSYGPGAAPFLRRCRELGVAAACDGLGMLAEQAAESFLVWRGERPDARPIIDALRRELAD